MSTYDDCPRPKRYTTLQDVIDQEIAPSLGDLVEDFDVEGIAEAVTTYRADRDEAGNLLANAAGFAFLPEYDDESDDYDLDAWERSPASPRPERRQCVVRVSVCLVASCRLCVSISG